ncbi:TPA: hypothetical protein IQA36_002802 [Listeria monocytogenes]|uniref:hypothetical protein n=1 Tax=Listeria monocytogenes TaxID=1639 RepID=UPI0010D00E05|nr:hypothetical protein [Listeria monocytogenes]EAE1294789.1 hypothetical protein [Listeria monocytogenes]HAO6018826.1 hypothetical protein [Listeria monocytogenes]HAO6018944.1 hypothetical protein [Listeria monocytogenes]HAO6738527.1 hypothetical protein [Listeria monocytogenes]
MIINKDLTQIENKENIQKTLLYESMSRLGISKNMIKFFREITDIEMLLINQNFKSLNDIETYKITTDKKVAKKLLTN